MSGRGNSGETLYDGINAFTDFFTHGNGVGKNTNSGQRVAKANFGRGSDWKRDAITIASNEDVLKSCMERGERLLNDRLLINSISN